MCYFLTIAVSPEHVTTLRTNIPRNLHLAAQSNRSITSQLEGAYNTFTLTTSGCSCYLYSEADDAPDVQAIEQQLREKYARRGWSADKVQRAVTSAMAHKARDEHFTGLRSDARDLLAEIAEETGTLLLLVHHYDAGPDAEAIPIRSRSTLTTDHLRAGRAEVSPDTLYRLRRG